MQHGADHGEAEKAATVRGRSGGGAAVSTDPREGALDDPTLPERVNTSASAGDRSAAKVNSTGYVARHLALSPADFFTARRTSAKLPGIDA